MNLSVSSVVISKQSSFLQWIYHAIIYILLAIYKQLSSFLNFIYRAEWQAKLVMLCAFSMMVFVQRVHPLYVGGGDPFDYISTARYLLGFPDGIYSPWRTPGMAIFHILSGTVLFDTWKGFILLYAAMSVAIPIFIYYSISWLTRSFALVAALISIAGMIPFAYSKVGVSDHLFYFFNFFSIFLIARFFYKPNSKIIYAIPLVIGFLNLVRPVAALYFWIFIVFALFYSIRHRKELLIHLIAASLIYISLMSGWALFDRAFGATAFETSYPAKTQLDRRFSEIYSKTNKSTLHFVVDRELLPVFKAENGPASKELYELLWWYLFAYPERWQNTNDPHIPYALFGKFAEKPTVLFNEILTKPNFVYFNFLRTAIQAKFGGQYAQFIQRLILEYDNSGISGAINFLKQNPSKMLLGSTPPMSGRNFLGVYYFAPHRVSLGRLFGYRKHIPYFFESGGVGPYTQEFVNAVQFFTENFPMYWENTNEYLRPFKGNPDELIKVIFNPKTKLQIGYMGMWEGYYWESLIKYYGINHADRLFTNAGLELLAQYPATIYLFWENILNIVLGFPPRNLESVNTITGLLDWGDLVYSCRVNYLIGLTPGLKSELQETILAKDGDPVRLIAKAYGTMHGCSTIFVVLTLLLFPFLFFKTSLRYFSCCVLLIYLYDVMGIAVFGGFNCPRYKDVFVLFPVMLACMGLYAFLYRITHKPQALWKEQDL